MISILQVFYSVFSGLLLSVAIPNELYHLGFPIITLFCVIPLYLVFYSLKNYKQAFFIGFIYTFTTHLFSSFWLANFKDFAAITLGASAFGTGMIGAIMGCVWYLPFSTSTSHNPLINNSLSTALNFTQTKSFKIIYFTATYVIYEWIKSSGFLGYPWGTISSAIFKWPILMQIASITGPYGITFLLVLFNTLIAEVYLYIYTPNPTNSTLQCFYLKNTAILCGILFLISIIFGFIQYNLPRKAQKYLTTIFVQQNSDPWKETSDIQSILNSQNLTKQRIEELNQSNKKADLIVWSEGTLRRNFPNGYSHYRVSPSQSPLVEFIKNNKTPLLVGGSYLRDKKTKKVFNAALMFDSQGNFRGYYAKNHLVPVAEATPGIEFEVIRNLMEKIGLGAGWYPGDQYVFFDIPCSYAPQRILPTIEEYDLSKNYNEQLANQNSKPTVKIATPICFDDAFIDIMRPLHNNGAELFVNMSDDSWSLKKSSEYQHFTVAAYRAIEYRTTMLRSCNAGYSVVIDPAGKILCDLPLFEQASAAYNIPIYKFSMTTYARFGNWLPYILVLLFFTYAIYCYFSFTPSDYIPSERKKDLSKKSKNHKK